MTRFAAGARYMGIALMILGIALFIIFYNFSRSMLELIDSGQVVGSCMTYETCPHIAILNQAYVGYGLSAAIFAIGILMAIFGGKPEKAESKPNKEKWNEVARKLAGDEKTIYEKVMASDGVMFQSDLVEQLGFPKAKVSRILDKMEAGGLVERKRRGMANALVLK